MQMSYGLYRRFLVDLACLKEPAVNAFQVVSFTRKKRHFQPSVKQRKIIKHMASKQQFLPETLSKFISTSRSIFACHHRLMAPCKIIQCYDQATVACDFRYHLHYRYTLNIFNLCRKKYLVNTEFNASRKSTIMANVYNEWINVCIFVLYTS